NKPIDVMRVTQRLKYLGFPGWGGGNIGVQDNRIAPANVSEELALDGVVASRGKITFQSKQFNLEDTTIEALRLFQATITPPQFVT
ncbi:hypothetical protein ACC689_35440, partial [Rhizobium ruizarguesonis]